MNAPTITPENVAGLVVGEGCFYCESAPDPKYRSGWRIRPAFCIEMRADDGSVLEAVRTQLGCGKIYRLDFGRYRGYESKGWHPHAKLRVTAIADLNSKICPFFRTYPLFGRKKEAFSIFEEIVDVIAARRHKTEEGLARAKGLAEQLAIHKSRGSR